MYAGGGVAATQFIRQTVYADGWAHLHSSRQTVYVTGLPGRVGGRQGRDRGEVGHLVTGGWAAPCYTVSFVNCVRPLASPFPPPQEHTWRPAFGVVRQGSCGRALRWAAPAGGRAVAPWRVRRVPERRTRALVRTSCGRAREGAHRRTLVHPECGGPSKGHAGKPLSDAPWGLAKDKRKNTMENRRQGQQQQKTRRKNKLHCKTQNNSQIS